MTKETNVADIITHGRVTEPADYYDTDYITGATVYIETIVYDGLEWRLFYHFTPEEMDQAEQFNDSNPLDELPWDSQHVQKVEVVGRA